LTLADLTVHSYLQNMFYQNFNFTSSFTKITCWRTYHIMLLKSNRYIILILNQHKI